jgi:hypothetical protein
LGQFVLLKDFMDVRWIASAGASSYAYPGSDRSPFLDLTFPGRDVLLSGHRTSAPLAVRIVP